MSDTQSSPRDIIQEATRIIERANAEGFPLRLLGGLAIYLQCPGMQHNPRLQRSYADLDFVTLSQWNGKTKALFTGLGYVGNKTFNALHGHQRLLFYQEEHGYKIDVFIDRMQMCHTLDFRTRLALDQRTLSVSDLLMTKLQIVEINEKDITDAIALLQDFSVGEDETGINTAYVAGLTAQDWGLYKTFELNLKKIQAFAAEQAFSPGVGERIAELLAAMEARPKSMKWKTRALVGERVRWYEIPEETQR